MKRTPPHISNLVLLQPNPHAARLYLERKAESEEAKAKRLFFLLIPVLMFIVWAAVKVVCQH